MRYENVNLMSRTQKTDGTSRCFAHIENIKRQSLSYTEINEVHKESILPVADLYGKIIALADPVLDFEEDMKKHKKSPLSLENREHYTQELFELMNYGKSLVLKLEKENKVSLYFQNTYALSCYNIENKLNK